MSEVTLREATRQDAPAIRTIYNHAILHSTAVYEYDPVSLQEREAWLTQRQGAGLPVLVAVQAGEVVGFGSYGPFRPRPAYSRSVEGSVYIHPDHVRHGHGTLLIHALLEHARAHGVHTFIGGVDAENAASLELLEGLGFVQAGRMREVGHKFGRWLDVIFMQLML